MLEQRGHELAPESLREFRRQRRLVGHAANAVGAEEPAHERGSPATGSAPDDRIASSTTRIREGLTRMTVMPDGTATCSGRRRSVISPGIAPARLTRALT